ncbi:hypothetical protein POM88_025288 [Heracleum sosnowskyi]|uniref:Uncharacterized protein n=1 Tax=Heracleum sosnowskyi TaxID=360622 RepID=A0AAD8MN15_9APIA|nr:hypothetical protein POM88_025288 [Heracleum sosnowskyi]
MKLPEYLGEDKTVHRHEFSVGSIVSKAKGKLENEFLRVPSTFERKDYFSFSLSVDENNDQLDSGGNYSLEDNHNVDHDILDFVDCIGRGIFKEKKCVDKLWAYTLSRAENEQPSLSGLITFNRIVPASSNPLNGIYIGSNGCLVTEVIQISHKFGHWPGHDGDDLSKLEPFNYVEVVKLTGDPDVSARQIPGGVTIAKGFKAAGMYGGLRAKGEKPDLAFLACDVDATAAGAFTKNVVAAAPVVYCKSVLEDSTTVCILS